MSGLIEFLSQQYILLLKWAKPRLIMLKWVVGRGLLGMVRVKKGLKLVF
jgi:hypothetical protein